MAFQIETYQSGVTCVSSHFLIVTETWLRLHPYDNLLLGPVAIETSGCQE